ncbi:MAG: superoxide dismutase family protein [Kiloniellaceae bacterium]
MTSIDFRNRVAAGRRRPVFTALIGGLALAGLAPVAWAAPGDSASAAMMNTDGAPVGTVELTETANGTAVLARLTNLPEGPHAFHVHETGVCEPPFASAGGHYNPDGASHGFHAEGGPHAGDLPNIYVPASGELTVEFFSTRLEISDSLFDDDGAAVVIHAGPDDHMTDPAGDAGPRIACGVLQKGPGN